MSEQNVNTPERIDVGGGYFWEAIKVSEDTGKLYGNFYTPDGDPMGLWYKDEVTRFAAALQPAPASHSAVEDIMAMSDEEILAQEKAAGRDPHAFAERMRAFVRQHASPTEGSKKAHEASQNIMRAVADEYLAPFSSSLGSLTISPDEARRQGELARLFGIIQRVAPSLIQAAFDAQKGTPSAGAVEDQNLQNALGLMDARWPGYQTAKEIIRRACSLSSREAPASINAVECAKAVGRCLVHPAPEGQVLMQLQEAQALIQAYGDARVAAAESDLVKSLRGRIAEYLALASNDNSALATAQHALSAANRHDGDLLDAALEEVAAAIQARPLDLVARDTAHTAAKDAEIARLREAAQKALDKLNIHQKGGDMGAMLGVIQGLEDALADPAQTVGEV